MQRTLIQAIASAIEARRNCETNGNKEWFARHTDAIRSYAKMLPHGCGIDFGCEIDVDKSTGSKVVITTAFHHMNDGGMYDGWTDHTVTVRPAFRGIEIAISGRNRNQIKDYLYETFDSALTQTIEE